MNKTQRKNMKVTAALMWLTL